MSSVFDVAGRPWVEPPKCRVFGLTSEAGRPLNGVCGKIISHGGVQGPPDTRVMVMLDGVDTPKSLKLGNLNVMPQDTVMFGVGVGREELGGQDGTDPTRPVELFVSLVLGRDRMGTVDVPAAAVSTCGRTVGNLMAVNHLLEQIKAREEANGQTVQGHRPIGFALTDLNVCGYVNQVAMDGGALSDAPPLHEVLAAPLQEMRRLVRIFVDAGVAIFAMFAPHRCTPDSMNGTPGLGLERLHSVLEHSVALYPTPHPQRSGCVEVRFVGTPASAETKYLTSQQSASGPGPGVMAYASLR